MRNIYISIALLFLTGCGVNVNKICEDSGYFIYERVDLPPEYIKQFTPEVDEGRNDSRFILNDKYYIDKDKLEEDYILTLRERKDLKGYKTWVLITDSIVRKSDGKVLAKQVTYSGYKSDEKPWLWELGYPRKDTSCPNGNVGKNNRNASFFNSFNIVKDVFINKDYKWAPETVLGQKAISNGDFEDLCENTGIKVYEKEIIHESYLIKPNDKSTFRGKEYLRYSDYESYFDINKLEQDYIFTYFENQLVPSTKNSRVIRSSITRKIDNKLLGETITVRGRKGDSYTGTVKPDLVCAADKTVQIQMKRDFDNELLRSVFFKDEIDYLLFQAPSTARWGDIALQNRAYTAYIAILQQEKEMALSQRIRAYRKLRYISKNLDNEPDFIKYSDKLISLNMELLTNKNGMSFDKIIRTYDSLIGYYKSLDDKAGILKVTNMKIAVYDNLLINKRDLSFKELVHIYEPLLTFSFGIGDKNKFKKYANEFADYLKVANKDRKNSWRTYEDLKQKICNYNWSAFKEVFIEHCGK